MIPVLIVPVLTRAQLLYDMLESIDHPVEKLIVLDNGDTVSRHVVADINHEHIARRYVWRFPSNIGVPVSWNLGIKATPFASWWMVSNFDVCFPSGALAQFAALSSPERVVLSAERANWCVFTIGENVVEQVGLFDEGIHPAYFEDSDYLRRCQAHGVDVHIAPITVNHQNSSTIANGYGEKNSVTFARNQDRFTHRSNIGDLSNGEWSLSGRRSLSWD
jgi:GT2 family glycosyltransferase